MTRSDPVPELYRRENRRVFATLVRLLGNFDLAEDAVQSAFLAAAERWPRDGMPGNPVGWLVSAGRFRAIDALRRQRRMTPWSEAADAAAEIPDDATAHEDLEAVEDDRLRLIFTCCHPSLSEEAAVAMTLREICRLSTEAIARAFLIPRRRWRSASCAPCRRSAMPASPTRCPRRTSCWRGSAGCCGSSTSFSTRAI